MTLSDLLVSVAVLGLLLGAAFVTLEQGQRAYAVGAARVEAQQAGRAALTWLSGELRAAGRGASRFAPVSVAEPARIVLHVDRNGDGVVAGAGETITWRLAGTILRRDAGGGAQPVVNGVTRFELAYADAEGRPTTDPAAVRAVTVTLATRADGVRQAAARDVGAVLATTARLRNR